MGGASALGVLRKKCHSAMDSSIPQPVVVRVGAAAIEGTDGATGALSGMRDWASVRCSFCVHPDFGARCLKLRSTKERAHGLST